MRQLLLLCVCVCGVLAAADPSQLENKCQAGEAKACVELAGVYHRGDKKLYIAPNSNKAQDLYLKACELGNNEGCDKFVKPDGWRNRGSDQDKQAFKDLCNKDINIAYTCDESGEYHKMCASNLAIGCEKLGEQAEYRMDLQRSQMYYAQAKSIRIQNCENGLAEDCEKLAQDYEKGDMADHQKAQEFHAKARSIYTKQCASGKANECEKAAKSYESGDHADYKQAKQLYDKAIALQKSSCDKGDYAVCLHLAEVFELDQYGFYENERSQGEIFYRKACSPTSTDSEVCYWVGYHYYKYRGDVKRAQEAFKRSCDLGNREGCSAYNQI